MPPSAPLVQDVQLVSNDQAGSDQPANRAHRVRWFHVLANDVLLVDEQDAGVGAPLRLPLGMECSEILWVLGDEHLAPRSGVRQMEIIVDTGDALTTGIVGRVTGLLQEDDQQSLVSTVIEVELHACLLEPQFSPNLVILCVDPLLIRIVVVERFQHSLQRQVILFGHVFRRPSPDNDP